MAETTDKPRLSEREHQENDQSDEIRPMEHLAHEVSNTMSVAPEAMGGHSVADLPPNYFKSIPFIATFLSVSLAYVACLLGYVMMATSVPIINQVFGPDPDVAWVLLTVVLGQTVVFTLNGRLSDIFGRRYFFIGGASLGLIGFVISGSAKDLSTIIGGNFIIGVGQGIMQTEGILFGEMIPNEYRYTVLGAVFVTFSPLIAVGPGLARILTEDVSWRWIYYLGAIISGLSGLLQVFFYFPPTFNQLHRSSSKRQAILNFDYGGTIIFSGSLISFVLGMSWAGQRYAWKSVEVIVPIVLGSVGLVGFALWEHYVPLKEPLVALYLFKNRNFVALTMVSGVGAMIFYALNLVYPQQIASVWGEDSVSSGWLTCTIIGGVMVGQFLAAVSTKWLARWVSLKTQLVATCVIFTAFIGAMAKVTADNKARAVVFSLISSAMVGLMEVITMAGAPLMVAPEDIGLANGIEFTVRGILSCISISVYATILTNKISHYFSTKVVPAALAAGISAENIPALLQNISVGNKAGLLEIPGMTPQILQTVFDAAVSAFAKSYQIIYLVSLAFGVTTIIFALLVDGKALDEKMTTEISRKLQPASVLHGYKAGHVDPEKTY